MTCSHTYLLMCGCILTIRNNSKILDAVQKDCCYFGISQNSSQVCCGLASSTQSALWLKKCPKPFRHSKGSLVVNLSRENVMVGVGTVEVTVAAQPELNLKTKL